MKEILCLAVFSILHTKTLSERWETSASFSKHDSFNKNDKLYKPPLPLQKSNQNFEQDDPTYNTFEPDQSYTLPFYPDFYYPPVNIPRPNDVLVIVLEQNMKCTNDTQKDEQPPQPTPKVFPPPSRCIWAIVACCAPTSVTFRYSCFNFLGCSGTFWQINPCQLPIIMLAVNDALTYYKQFEPQPAPVPAPTEAPVNANTTEVPTPETTTQASTTSSPETTTTAAVSEEPPAKLKS